MNLIQMIILGTLLLAAAFLAAKAHRGFGEFLANAITTINTTPKGRGTRLADASFTLRYLLAKQGSDATHIGICGATDKPFAVVPDMTPTADQAASDLSYPLPVNILGLNEDTERMVASAAIAVDDLVVPAGSGKVKTLPTTAGVYWVVGKAVTAASADADLLEVAPCFPYQVQVGVGYVSGAGGAVTQGTDRSTGVTLSTLTGQITTNAASLAAGAEATFTVTNTLVAATDIIVLSLTAGGTGSPQAYVSTVAAGSFAITVTNLHASTADTSADVINFAVIKGVAA